MLLMRKDRREKVLLSEMVRREVNERSVQQEEGKVSEAKVVLLEEIVKEGRVKGEEMMTESTM